MWGWLYPVPLDKVAKPWELAVLLDILDGNQGGWHGMDALGTTPVLRADWSVQDGREPCGAQEVFAYYVTPNGPGPPRGGR